MCLSDKMATSEGMQPDPTLNGTERDSSNGNAALMVLTREIQRLASENEQLKMDLEQALKQMDDDRMYCKIRLFGIAVITIAIINSQCFHDWSG